MLERSLVLAALYGMPFMATAITIDLYHESIGGDKNDKGNADHAPISHRSANRLGFTIEVKWYSGSDNGL